MRTHKLKCWPSHFEAVKAGTKTCEVRRNDRDFAVGDRLVLHAYDPNKREYLLEDGGTTHMPHHFTELLLTITVEVTHIVHGGQFGIEPGYCMMSIKALEVPHA